MGTIQHEDKTYPNNWEDNKHGWLHFLDKISICIEKSKENIFLQATQVWK